MKANMTIEDLQNTIEQHKKYIDGVRKNSIGKLFDNQTFQDLLTSIDLEFDIVEMRRELFLRTREVRYVVGEQSPIVSGPWVHTSDSECYRMRGGLVYVTVRPFCDEFVVACYHGPLCGRVFSSLDEAKNAFDAWDTEQGHTIL